MVYFQIARINHSVVTLLVSCTHHFGLGCSAIYVESPFVLAVLSFAWYGVRVVVVSLG